MLSAAVNARLFPGRRRPANIHNNASRRDVYHRRLCCEVLENRRLLSVGVGGRVWSDLNSDGIQDAGEPGVAGAVVEIYSSTDTTIGDADDVSCGIAISDTDGNYAFSGLPDGLYYYEVFRIPAGYTFTTRDAGSDDSIDSDPYTSGIALGRTALFGVFPGQTDSTRDAGLLGGAPAFGFAFSAGAEERDNGSDVTTDVAGNLYVTGSFEKTVDFDPGPGTYNLTAAGSIGYNDVFVAKYTPAGALAWARRMGGSGYDYGYGITVADDGSIYITGSFTNTADFNPGPGTYNLTSAGSSDIFVSKLDAAGNFVWARNMGGTSSDTGYSIAVANDGGVYTTGYFHHTADFDPGPATVNFTVDGNAPFISKLDASGNYVWACYADGTNWDTGQDIVVAGDGSVYATGTFQYTVDFDPGAGTFNLTSKGGNDIYVWKLDSSGNLVWARSMGGTGMEEARGIALADDGSVYTTGAFQGAADFDPGTGTLNLTCSGGYYDVFVSKLDSAGSAVWARRMGGSGEECGYDIAVGSNGNVYTTGVFSAAADFDPGPATFNLPNAGYYDIFISELNSAGDFVGAYRMGGSSSEGGSGITVSNDGSIYTTGSFTDTVDFDPGPGVFNLTSTGSDELKGDIFVSKLRINHTPTDIDLSNNSIAENQPSGTAVGTFSTTDYNIGDTFAYTLVTGTGSTDNASFAISGDTLQTTDSFDYEAKNSYSIRVRSTDQGELYTEKVFAINVTDVNEAPSIASLTNAPNPVVRPNPLTLEALGVIDPENSIVSVAFYRETNGVAGLQTVADADTLVGTDTEGADGWSITFPTEGLAPGIHTYYAQATDNEAATSPDGTSAPSTSNSVQAVLFVDADAAPSGDGLTWATAFNDLQAALDQAALFNGDTISGNDVDQIWIAEGTYKPTAELEPGDARSASFSLLDSVTLYGGFAGGETSLDERDWVAHVTTLSGDLGTPADTSDNAYTVVYCGENIESTLDGLTITAGNADGDLVRPHYERRNGGGIYNYGGTLTVTNSTISNNSADDGGGGIDNYGTLTVTNSTISDNSSSSGGGISTYSYVGTIIVTVINSTISGNSAEVGGGILNYADLKSTSTVTVMNSTISENSATKYDGGGIYNYGGYKCTATVAIMNSTLSNNSAGDDGGGIYNNGTNGTVTVTVTNSTISSNNSSSHGGGIYNYDSGTITVTNSTISGNSAGYDGGGICNHATTTTTITSCTISGNSSNRGGGIGNSGTLTVTNSMISGNSAGEYGGGLHNRGTLTVTNSTLSGNLANTFGGGIYSKDSSQITILNNTIVAGNETGSGPDIYLYSGDLSGFHNLIGDGTGQAAIVNGVNGNIVGTAENSIDPFFVRNPDDGGDGWGDDPATPDVDESANDNYGDLRLCYGSPAVDAGSDALAVDGEGNPLVTDIDGNPRIIGRYVDIGAYESCVPARLFGDANLDALVNERDAAALAANWLKPSGATWEEGDFNGDKRVDDIDATVMAANWGRSVFFFPGDANRDGWVDDSDAAIVAAHWLKPPSAPGDANLDGFVNEADAAILSANWPAQSGATWTDGDFNRDGRVDDVDATLMACNWQRDFSHLLLGWTDGDFNGDGFVNDIDTTIMAVNWGRTLMPPPTTALQASTSASPAAADEPGSETPTADSEAVVDDANNDEEALRVVRYDLDNSGRVDLGDLAFFASVYREKPGVTTENPYAYAADYDGSGTVDLGDLALFAVHYQLCRANDVTVPLVEASSATAQTTLATDDYQTPVETLSEQFATPTNEQSTALSVEQSVTPAEQSAAPEKTAISKTPAYKPPKENPTLLPGDVNRDGRVDDTDATAITLYWRKPSAATWADGNFSGDGRINYLDTAILARHWMITVEDMEDNDDIHDKVFAEFGTTDDAFLLYDE